VAEGSGTTCAEGLREKRLAQADAEELLQRLDVDPAIRDRLARVRVTLRELV